MKLIPASFRQYSLALPLLALGLFGSSVGAQDYSWAARTTGSDATAITGDTATWNWQWFTGGATHHRYL